VVFGAPTSGRTHQRLSQIAVVAHPGGVDYQLQHIVAHKQSYLVAVQLGRHPQTIRAPRANHLAMGLFQPQRLVFQLGYEDVFLKANYQGI